MSALRATLRREITLIRRTSFIYIFRTFQVGFQCWLASLVVINGCIDQLTNLLSWHCLFCCDVMTLQTTAATVTTT